MLFMTLRGGDLLCQNERLAKKFDLGLEEIKQATGIEYEVSAMSFC